jgi:16S rRNA (uracil1498-N3)-methyltransferase
MNLILFSPTEFATPLLLTDPRAKHILNVLNTQQDESFDVGQINGPRGKAKLIGIEKNSLLLSFLWENDTLELYPIDLWVSFCRPQTCRKILQECTSLGVRSFTFFDTEKCEPGYKTSRLWTTGESERLMKQGAEQAFCTRIPTLTLGSSLEDTMPHASVEGARIAMDNYESTEELTSMGRKTLPITVALGGERGWSKRERDLLRANNFILAGLGNRVLRTETACIAAISILRSHLTH